MTRPADTSVELKQQADLFTRYLVGKQATTKIKDNYQQAVRTKTAPLNKRDRHLLVFILRHPRFLGVVDAGLAFSEPFSEIRRRLFITFALLESTPEYANYFLSKKRGPFFMFYAPLLAFWAGCKIVLGLGFVRMYCKHDRI